MDQDYNREIPVFTLELSWPNASRSPLTLISINLDDITKYFTIDSYDDETRRVQCSFSPLVFWPAQTGPLQLTLSCNKERTDDSEFISTDQSVCLIQPEQFDHAESKDHVGVITLNQSQFLTLQFQYNDQNQQYYLKQLCFTIPDDCQFDNAINSYQTIPLVTITVHQILKLDEKSEDDQLGQATIKYIDSFQTFTPYPDSWTGKYLSGDLNIYFKNQGISLDSKMTTFSITVQYIAFQDLYRSFEVEKKHHHSFRDYLAHLLPHQSVQNHPIFPSPLWKTLAQATFIRKDISPFENSHQLLQNKIKLNLITQNETDFLSTLHISQPSQDILWITQDNILSWKQTILTPSLPILPVLPLIRIKKSEFTSHQPENDDGIVYSSQDIPFLIDPQENIITLPGPFLSLFGAEGLVTVSLDFYDETTTFETALADNLNDHWKSQGYWGTPQQFEDIPSTSTFQIINATPAPLSDFEVVHPVYMAILSNPKYQSSPEYESKYICSQCWLLLQPEDLATKLKWAELIEEKKPSPDAIKDQVLLTHTFEWLEELKLDEKNEEEEDDEEEEDTDKSTDQLISGKQLDWRLVVDRGPYQPLQVNEEVTALLIPSLIWSEKIEKKQQATLFQTVIQELVNYLTTKQKSITWILIEATLSPSLKKVLFQRSDIYYEYDNHSPPPIYIQIGRTQSIILETQVAVDDYRKTHPLSEIGPRVEKVYFQDTSTSFMDILPSLTTTKDDKVTTGVSTNQYELIATRQPESKANKRLLEETYLLLSNQEARFLIYQVPTVNPAEAKSQQVFLQTQLVVMPTESTPQPEQTIFSYLVQLTPELLHLQAKPNSEATADTDQFKPANFQSLFASNRAYSYLTLYKPDELLEKDEDMECNYPHDQRLGRYQMYNGSINLPNGIRAKVIQNSDKRLYLTQITFPQAVSFLRPQFFKKKRQSSLVVNESDVLDLIQIFKGKCPVTIQQQLKLDDTPSLYPLHQLIRIVQHPLVEEKAVTWKLPSKMDQKEYQEDYTCTEQVLTVCWNAVFDPIDVKHPFENGLMIHITGIQPEQYLETMVQWYNRFKSVILGVNTPSKLEKFKQGMNSTTTLTNKISTKGLQFSGKNLEQSLFREQLGELGFSQLKIGDIVAWEIVSGKDQKRKTYVSEVIHKTIQNIRVLGNKTVAYESLVKVDPSRDQAELAKLKEKFHQVQFREGDRVGVNKRTKLASYSGFIYKVIPNEGWALVNNEEKSEHKTQPEKVSLLDLTLLSSRSNDSSSSSSIVRSNEGETGPRQTLNITDDNISTDLSYVPLPFGTYITYSPFYVPLWLSTLPKSNNEIGLGVYRNSLKTLAYYLTPEFIAAALANFKTDMKEIAPYPSALDYNNYTTIEDRVKLLIFIEHNWNVPVNEEFDKERGLSIRKWKEACSLQINYLSSIGQNIGIPEKLFYEAIKTASYRTLINIIGRQQGSDYVISQNIMDLSIMALRAHIASLIRFQPIDYYHFYQYMINNQDLSIDTIDEHYVLASFVKPTSQEALINRSYVTNATRKLKLLAFYAEPKFFLLHYNRCQEAAVNEGISLELAVVDSFPVSLTLAHVATYTQRYNILKRLEHGLNWTCTTHAIKLIDQFNNGNWGKFSYYDIFIDALDKSIALIRSELERACRKASTFTLFYFLVNVLGENFKSKYNPVLVVREGYQLLKSRPGLTEQILTLFNNMQRTIKFDTWKCQFKEFVDQLACIKDDREEDTLLVKYETISPFPENWSTKQVTLLAEYIPKEVIQQKLTEVITYFRKQQDKEYGPVPEAVGSTLIGRLPFLYPLTESIELSKAVDNDIIPRKLKILAFIRDQWRTPTIHIPFMLEPMSLRDYFRVQVESTLNLSRWKNTFLPGNPNPLKNGLFSRYDALLFLKRSLGTLKYENLNISDYSPDQLAAFLVQTYFGQSPQDDQYDRPIPWCWKVSARELLKSQPPEFFN